jgi:site-specific DNA-cytosine methylase
MKNIEKPAALFKKTQRGITKRRKRVPTVAALFAGVGGLELGMKRSGFRTIFACEIDKTAQQLLRMRFPEARLWSDIRNLRALPTATVVTAGFPCQDLSQAGLTAGLRGSTRQQSMVAEENC